MSSTKTKKPQKSLATGMTSTDICDIIGKCASCGVGRLQFGDLCVEFTGWGGVSSEVPTQNYGTAPATQISHIDQDTKDGHNEIDEVRFPNLDEHLMDLALTDPEEFERLVEEGLDREVKCN